MKNSSDIRGQKITFNPTHFDFAHLFEEVVILFCEKKYGNSLVKLTSLHEVVKEKDIEELSQKLYELMRSQRFQTTYVELCNQIVKEHLPEGTKFQKLPSLRIQLPHGATVSYHTDHMYGHGPEIVNFWLPLMNTNKTNTLYLASADKSISLLQDISDKRMSITEINFLCRKECSPVLVNYGEVLVFDASMLHGSEKNISEETRISFDFRMQKPESSIGFKPEKFFRSTNMENETVHTEERTAIGYIGQGKGFSKFVPPKNQILTIHSYCRENHITIQLTETEILTMSHFPILMDMLEGSEYRKMTSIVFYSTDLLPRDSEMLDKILSLSRDRGLELIFASEDIIYPTFNNKADVVRTLGI
ncbi:MAG: phytanoyl-CoA dioxygenase family protein [Bdellovibrionota bacterium]